MRTLAPVDKVTYRAVSRDRHEKTYSTKRLCQFAVESRLEPADFWVAEMDLPPGWHVVSFHGTREAAQRAADANKRESAVIVAKPVQQRRNRGAQ